jgi:hypothetical protein
MYLESEFLGTRARFVQRSCVMSPDAIRAVQGDRPVADHKFDDLFPEWTRAASDVHWSPITVARRAAELLVEKPGDRVLDVGSGVGKLCIVGALTTPGTFVGVEQRGSLVAVARNIVRRHRIPRCTFVHANMTEVDWSTFDAFYLYNPFEENLSLGRHIIDETVERSVTAYREYVSFVETQLVAARPGTRLVTFHGFGGRMPPRWTRRRRERRGSGKLDIWVKLDG